MSFEQLKQRSQNKDALIEKLSSLDSGKEKKSYKDERFWRPTVDDSGTASAVIRFLPNVKMKRTLLCFTILTLSKVRAVGSSRTLVPPLVRKILFPNTTLVFGTAASNPTRIWFHKRQSVRRTLSPTSL